MGKLMYSSSSYNVTNSAHVAIDGDADICWCVSDSSFPQTLTVDFGAIKDIAQVDILFEQAGEWEYTLRISEDGWDWKDYAVNPDSIPKQQEVRLELYAGDFIGWYYLEYICGTGCKRIDRRDRDRKCQWAICASYGKQYKWRSLGKCPGGGNLF